MSAQANTAAPELALDAQSQTGFVKWFNGLEQVRRQRPGPGRGRPRRTAPLRHARLHRAASAPAATSAPPCSRPTRPPRLPRPRLSPRQDPQLIRFFDRKVRGPCPASRLPPRRHAPGRPAPPEPRAPAAPRAARQPQRLTPPPPPANRPQGFYSVHGDNALFVARTFYRTTAVVKYLGAGGGGGGGAGGAPSGAGVGACGVQGWGWVWGWGGAGARAGSPGLLLALGRAASKSR
jgi:hypothetical protein